LARVDRGVDWTTWQDWEGDGRAKPSGHPNSPGRDVVAVVGRGVWITDVGAGASVVVGAGGGGGGGGGATGCCGWVVGVTARLTLVGAAARSGSGSTVGSAGGGTTEVACGAGA
jgi:hypothetical protein